jgi:purine-binding chemotaxis protein CheW
MATKKRQNLVDGVLQGYLDDLLGMADVFVDQAFTPSGAELSDYSSIPASAEACGHRDPATAVVTVTSVAAVASNTEASPAAAWPRFAEPPVKLKAPLPNVAVEEVKEVAREAVVTPDDVIKPVNVEPENVALNPSRSTEVADTEHRHELDGKSDLASLNWQSGNGVDCLLFTVSGLKLAIPLPLLGGVHKVNERVTPLFGQASWSLGVWQGDDLKLTIIDSAQLIMPERGTRPADDGYDYFIQLDRSPWALACQDILDTVKLDNNAIKWRGDASKRRWLAGTVIKEMCALIDVPGLLQLLEDSRRKGSLKPGRHAY